MHRRQSRGNGRGSTHELLQEPDVEDIVQPGAGRELEAVGDVVDDGRDAVRPIVPGSQLPFGDAVEGGRGAMAETKPDPITHAVMNFAVMLVVEPLVDGLSLLQPGPGISQHFIVFSHGLGHHSHPGFARLIGTDGGWLTAVDELEWRGLERGLKGGVVDVFRPW